MSRAQNKLTARQVATLGAGRHSDGGGLYLDRDSAGRSRWVFMYSRGGKRREAGLGPAGPKGVLLADARAAADEARKILRAGGDPIEARRAAMAAKQEDLTFGAFAEQFLPEIAKGFRNAKHAAQWTSTLKTYAKALWDKPLPAVATDDVLECLNPIWTTKAETASRVRGRIERVLDAARAKGLRTGENPARWRGHLDTLLSKRRKLARGHHAALPFPEMPAFMAALRARQGVANLALEFTVLTAARSGETFGARWSEIDMKAKVWTVPGERMKAGRPHRVPLTASALAVLRKAEPFRGVREDGSDADADRLIFPGAKPGRPLSVMAMDMLLRRMKLDVTVHGFRSSFRDWVGEMTSFPREIAEAALAHVVGDETERAYRRGDALERRRKLMVAWANFCDGAAPKAGAQKESAR